MLESLLPHPPEDGPPVPRLLPLWPWVKSNNPAIYDVDAEIEEMTQRKREEFQRKGYSPGLTERALLWAREWAFGLPGVKAAFDISPEVGKQVYKGIYKQALALSNRWIESVSEFLIT